jgi:hypothetical protein
MKYALLNHLPLEQFEARKDPALISTWKSYLEAIQASGVIMESVGLQPPDKATMVSVRSGIWSTHRVPLGANWGRRRRGRRVERRLRGRSEKMADGRHPAKNPRPGCYTSLAIV